MAAVLSHLCASASPWCSHTSPATSGHPSSAVHASPDRGPLLAVPPLRSTRDLRAATGTMAAVLFTWSSPAPGARTPRQLHAVGLRTSGPTRSATLGQIKMLCAVLVTAAHMIFMTGQYLAGAKLFAAPVDLAPVPDAVCRSGAQRLAWRARAPPPRGAPSRRSRVPLAPTPAPGYPSLRRRLSRLRHHGNVPWPSHLATRRRSRRRPVRLRRLLRAKRGPSAGRRTHCSCVGAPSSA